MNFRFGNWSLLRNNGHLNKGSFSCNFQKTCKNEKNSNLTLYSVINHRVKFTKGKKKTKVRRTRSNET